MPILGLFQRYRRWNPVHPTYGAFWGLGFGLGCGVGWGPGFGPEVVGYVGSGCGLGLNIGVTLVGVGVGLPATGLTCVPCNVVTGAGQRVSQAAAFIGPIMSKFAIHTWHSMSARISLLDQQLRFSQKAGDRSLSRQDVPPNVNSFQPPLSGDSDEYNRKLPPPAM